MIRTIAIASVVLAVRVIFAHRLGVMIGRSLGRLFWRMAAIMR